MNGIVHPCSHPENKPAPATEDEMMKEVFLYTERVVNMVRPRKLLMMAIDGVAPRAKMNQQRSRRFRSAKEAKEKEDDRQKGIRELESLGHQVSDETKNKKAWDSNAITPGTPFMDLLAISLRYWVAKKMNEDKGWQNLQVIISDSSVPGEGEHKIMDFIRRQRSQPDHDPNTEHVIYGLDADLIMLALATHEPNFRVLREDVFAQADKQRSNNRGSNGQPANTQGEKEKGLKLPSNPPPFIFLDVGVLREYLAFELKLPNMPFSFNLELAIDDWVFMIFFVGNDFLPHLPSLEIREGAIDTLLAIWKRNLPLMGGYVTNHGDVNLSRAQLMLNGLAESEDEIFRKRRETEERQNANAKRRKIEQQRRESGYYRRENSYYKSDRAPLPSDRNMDLDKESSKNDNNDANVGGVDYVPQLFKPNESIDKKSNDELIENRHKIRLANLSAADSLKSELNSSTNSNESKRKYEDDENEKKDDDDEQIPGVKVTKAEPDDEEIGEDNNLSTSKIKKKVNEDGTVEQEDTIKLWEPGYRQRYYKQKFDLDLSDVDERRKIVHKYLEGLCWVLKYYYQGCPSWNWYYPYHYAPFAADFENIESLSIQFDLGEPFKPFEQLMGVFPAASGIHIPEPFSRYMTDIDSPILDFYPSNFEIDMNGNKMPWQGVALLPFIDEIRLKDALNARHDELTEDEKRRNTFGNPTLIISENNKLYDQISELYTKRKKQNESKVELDKSNCNNLFGIVELDPDLIPGSTFYSPLSLEDQPDLIDDKSISAKYEFPKQVKPHKSLILKNFIFKNQQLSQYDLEKTRGGGGNPHNRGFSHNTFRDGNSAVPRFQYSGNNNRPPNNTYNRAPTTSWRPRPPPPPPSSNLGRGGVFSPSLGYGNRPPPPSSSFRPRPPPPTNAYSGYNSGGFKGNFSTRPPPSQNNNKRF